jgi:uncharacterized protein YbbC (DUF1343 family)
MKFGIDRLIHEPALRKPLTGRRVALLAHPASVTAELVHSLDAVGALSDIELVAAFGPQHGLRGDKQDNMVESPDFVDPVQSIPVFSLYGNVRRPTSAMMDTFDALLVDLQDVGCRVYTFITTLRYILEEAAHFKKAVWVLDRPNPVGRPVEGLRLRPGWESFVGAGDFPMRHGLTVGEMATWFVRKLHLDVDLEIVSMDGWTPDEAPGFGWPVGERSWVNPSPNAPNLSMARCYSGTVLFEGTTISEGRGTTRPLELFGAPGLDPRRIVAHMHALAGDWLAGCRLRECWFDPTFHKHSGELCGGIQIHVDDPAYDHGNFRPWRVAALFLKSLRLQQPDREIWREFVYEYESTRLAIDLIAGSELLRQWIDDPTAVPEDLDSAARADETSWLDERDAFLLYR